MTLTAASGQRDELLQWLTAGRGRDFLTTAAPYLHAHAEDHHVRLMAIREYLKLGLVLPAKELLDGDGAGVSLPADFDALRTSLMTLPAAPVSWKTLTGRFEANLTALRGRGVPVDLVDKAWARRRGEFQLFRDHDGIEQVRMRIGGDRWVWIPRFGDHPMHDAAQAIPTDGTGPMPMPILFEGLDLGGFFERVYDATLDTFLGYSCALFVIEPDPAMLALVWHLRDWQRIAADPRVFWFVGDGCVDRLARTWNDDRDLPFPSHGLTLSRFRPGCTPSAVEVVQRASEARERELHESLADLEARYAGRDVHYWSRRFEEALSGGGEPLRILAGVSTHTTFLQYSMRDTKRALESLGHRCVVLSEQSPYHIVGPLSYHDAIREHDPDLFFNIDHLRGEFGGLLPANLPMLTWDQDQLPHVFTPANMRTIGPLDFVVGYSKITCVSAGCDPAQFLFARVPTCPEQFGGEPLSEEERTRYTCDVSFVSHASQTARAFHDEERSRFNDPHVKALLDVMFELAGVRLREHSVLWGGVPDQIVDEAARRVGAARPVGELRTRLIGWYLWRLGDRVFRHEALEWVADWARRTGRSFRIYGNGWEKHDTLAEFAAGPADNGRALLCIHRASRINLQLMPAGFIHQRALDGLASGGFFLSRATPSDLRGRVLRRLDSRIAELGITSTRGLLEHNDAELRSLLTAYYGEWLHLVDRDREDFYHGIRVPAEEPYPDEVFPRFEDIRFDSSEAFATKADRFLSDDRARRTIAEDMRRVVVERFSYSPTMDRFLRAMAAHLSHRARSTAACSTQP